MGFFSWKTADSKKSIPNVDSGRNKLVYLLQPDGEKAIEEAEYDGYGNFGGVNAYVWLARRNLPPHILDGKTDRELYMMGVGLESGSVYRDRDTGQIWLIFHLDFAPIVPEAKFFAGTYADEIPGYWKSANDLIESGRLIEMKIGELVGVKYPLKFSFKPEAVYENLPASDICPKQGYFY